MAPLEGFMVTTGNENTCRQRLTRSKYNALLLEGYNGIWAYDKGSDILPCREYLQHCLASVFEIGEKAHTNFLDETFLIDRATSIRQYLLQHPEVCIPTVRRQALDALCYQRLPEQYATIFDVHRKGALVAFVERDPSHAKGKHSKQSSNSMVVCAVNRRSATDAHAEGDPGSGQKNGDRCADVCTSV